MPDALDDAADEARQRFRIPPVNAPENRSSIYDGWYVTARGARFIGLIRSYDVDLRPGPDHVEMQPRLLARELMEHMADERISTHVSRSFAAMDAAGHHVDDQAIVLAIASREASPRAVITTSDTYRCTYHRGGADDAWGRRHRLPLPPAMRRRLRPATDLPDLNHPGQYRQHRNEAGDPIEPADVRGYDQLILYAGYVARAEAQLRAQIRRVFESDAEAVLTEMSIDTRRAWTQLSFGRGGGGGLVRALRRARELGSLESIFTDPVMLASDSIKRARVTAGDAFLIARFVLRESLTDIGRDL